MNDDTLAAHLERLHHQNRPLTTADVAADLEYLDARFIAYRRSTNRIITFLGTLAGFEGVFLVAWAVTR